MLTTVAGLMTVLAFLAALLVPLAIASGHPALADTRLYEPDPARRAVAIVAASITSVLLILVALATWLTATLVRVTG